MGVGHLWLKWVGQLWQSELLFFGLQGSILSSHCMTTGFSPSVPRFHLPTASFPGLNLYYEQRMCKDLGMRLTMATLLSSFLLDIEPCPGSYQHELPTNTVLTAQALTAKST